VPRLTIWIDNSLYERLCDLQTDEQKKRKMSVSMSRLVREILKKSIYDH